MKESPNLKKLQEIDMKITATALNLSALMQLREQSLHLLFPSDYPDGIIDFCEDANLNAAIRGFLDALPRERSGNP